MRNGGHKKLKKELWASHKREKTQEPWHKGNSLASEANQGCKITDIRGKGAEGCTGPMAGRNHVTGQVTGGSTGQENTKMPETI